MIYCDVQNLACAVLGLNYFYMVGNLEEDKIDKALYEKFNISFEQFYDIVGALLPFTPAVKAALSGGMFHAFVNEKEGLMLVKEPVKKAGLIKKKD